MKFIGIVVVLFLFPFFGWAGTFLETFDDGDLEEWQELETFLDTRIIDCLLPFHPRYIEDLNLEICAVTGETNWLWEICSYLPFFFQKKLDNVFGI